LQLKHEDGTPINPDLATRRAVLKYIGTMIPQLKSRIANPKGGDLPVQATTSQNQQGKKGKGKGKR